jgi:dephospho-CoA kinase
VYAGKPIIGIVGGIGSGKSFVAKLFGELGCLVVDSDAQVRDAYRNPAVVETLRGWWGDEVVNPDGSVNRSAVAARVFTQPAEKLRLEQLVHPMVHDARAHQMDAASKDPQVVAFIWDTPLLLEAGLAGQCDAIVFVDAPFEQRLARVKARNDWDEVELLRREKSQLALDSKRALSDYVITNTAEAKDADSAMAGLREQVRRVLSQILTGSTTKRRPAEPGR